MSKILAISDIHGEVSGFHKLKDYMESANISDIIVLGDYSASIDSLDENREDVKALVNAFGDLANIYAVPGNCDARDVVKVLRSFGIYCHNEARTIGGYNVLLYGGSNITPFDTPWEVDDEVVYNDLKALFAAHSDGPHLLAVHAPPKDTKCDVIPNGAHVGSEAVRRIIEEFAPAFVLCSHIHECAGRTDRIGESEVLNIGRLGDGHFVEISAEGMEHKKL